MGTTLELVAGLDRHAASQHGALRLADLRALGLTDRKRERLLEAGVLVRVWDGSYRVPGAPRSWKGDVLSACWAGGTRSVASHRSAAALWGIAGGDERLVELLCPRWRRTRHGGLVVHESNAVSSRDVTELEGIPVTSIERTILDLGAVRSAAVVERAMEDALRRELTSLAALRATVRRLGRSGRNGAGVLRRILTERDPDRRLTQSDVELRMGQMLRRHGLPAPVFQHEIWHQGRLVARVDGALVEWRVALEYESYEWHTGRMAIVRDNARRNALVAIDWKPIGVTWEDLRTGGHRVCAQIREAMRLRHTAA